MFPEPQKKPERKLNYRERVAAGLQRGGLKPKSDKQLERDKLEAREHNKNIKKGVVFCVKCGSDKHIEKHHVKGRNFPDEFVYLCGEFGCAFHSWIHKNENEAYELGWLAPEYRGLPHKDNWPKPWLE